MDEPVGGDLLLPFDCAQGSLSEADGTRVEGWQVRADAPTGTFYGNGGTWWSFAVSATGVVGSAPAGVVPFAELGSGWVEESALEPVDGEAYLLGPAGPYSSAPLDDSSSSGLDPVSWTLPERRVRCPQWSTEAP